MLRHHPFLAVALLLLLFCHASSGAHADDAYTRRVTLLEGGSKNFMEGNKSVSRELNSFGALTLVDVNGTIVAVAETYFGENNKSLVGIVSGSLVTTEGTSGTLRPLRMDGHEAAAERLVDLFFGLHSQAKDVLGVSPSNSNWTEKMVASQVADKNSTYDFIRLTSGGGSVNMGFSNIYAKFLENKLEKKFLTRLVGVSAGIWMKDGTFVLPVQMMGDDERIVSLILKYGKSEGGWRLSGNSSAPGCTNPSVAEWEEGKLIMITSCYRGYRKVYESVDKGETWTEAVGTLSRVWGNSQKRDVAGSRNEFITAEIEGQKVMLFAHTVSLEDGTPGQLCLWMTDNTRILNVNLISTRAEKVTASSLMYKNGRLYCLYETNNGRRKVIFAELTGALARIKYVLNRWKDLKLFLSKNCSVYDAVAAVQSRRCASPIPTAGLVGLLANTTRERMWHDEYRCVGATLVGATKIPNGLLFRGAGAGAQWPVSKQGQSQRYYFANNGFSLVATVALHAIPTGVSPVLGVSLGYSGLDKLLALSITCHKHWLPIYGYSAFSSTGRWEVNREYQVVFTWDGRRGSIYLDGVLMPGSGEVDTRGPVDIKYFYFGGYGTGDLFTANEVSVANVLLYNRPLNDTEVETLLQIKAKIPVPPAEKRTVHLPPAKKRTVHLPPARRPAVQFTPQRATSSEHSGSYSAASRVSVPQPPVNVAATLVDDAEMQITSSTSTGDDDQMHMTNDYPSDPILQVADATPSAGSDEEMDSPSYLGEESTLQESRVSPETTLLSPETSAFDTNTSEVEEDVLTDNGDKIHDAKLNSSVMEQINSFASSHGSDKSSFSLIELLNTVVRGTNSSSDGAMAVCVSYVFLLLLGLWGIAALC